MDQVQPEQQSQPAAPETQQEKPELATQDKSTPAQPEAAPQANQSEPLTAPPQEPVDSPIADGAAASSPAVSGQNPAIADDVDVIEKEWVDRAEQVIDETRDDPYMEEEAVEDLQIDYLQKRYGKAIKKPAEE